jgi:hypothetical protein
VASQVQFLGYEQLPTTAARLVIVGTTEEYVNGLKAIAEERNRHP